MIPPGSESTAFRLGWARPGRADTDVKAGLEKRGEEMSVLRSRLLLPCGLIWLQSLRHPSRQGRHGRTRRAREVDGWVGGWVEARRPCCGRWRRVGNEGLDRVRRLRASKRDAKRSGAATASASALASVATAAAAGKDASSSSPSSSIVGCGGITSAASRRGTGPAARGRCAASCSAAAARPAPAAATARRPGAPAALR